MRLRVPAQAKAMAHVDLPWLAPISRMTAPSGRDLTLLNRNSGWPSSIQPVTPATLSRTSAYEEYPAGDPAGGGFGFGSTWVQLASEGEEIRPSAASTSRSPGWAERYAWAARAASAASVGPSRAR